MTVTANYSGVTTIASSPSGLSFSVSGTGCQPGAYSTPQPMAWTPGSSCSVSFSPIQSGGTGTQYSFTSWADGPSTATRTLSASTQAATYTANFQKQYLLTTSTATGGSITPGGYFNEGTGVAVSATASAGYQFLGFSGDLSGLSTPQTIVMNGPHSVAAAFSLIEIAGVCGRV